MARSERKFSPQFKAEAVNRSRALPVDRCGEGHLSDRVDVLDAVRAQVELLPVRHRAMSATAQRRAKLAVLVGDVFDEFRQTYGCRRIARELNARGQACSVGLVADLMREMGLKAVQPLAYRVTTVHGEADEYPPDLVGRDFTAAQPGVSLVGDITFAPGRDGSIWPR